MKTILFAILVGLICFLIGGYSALEYPVECYVLTRPGQNAVCIIDRDIQTYANGEKAMVMRQGYPIDMGAP